MTAASAEARLRRIFDLCRAIEELSQMADSPASQRLIELLHKSRGYRLTTRDQVRTLRSGEGGRGKQKRSVHAAEHAADGR